MFYLLTEIYRLRLPGPTEVLCNFLSYPENNLFLCHCRLDIPYVDGNVEKGKEVVDGA
jgi:hypothetical protein